MVEIKIPGKKNCISLNGVSKDKEQEEYCPGDYGFYRPGRFEIIKDGNVFKLIVNYLNLEYEIEDFKLTEIRIPVYGSYDDDILYNITIIKE
jgi:hypothetical protein